MNNWAFQISRSIFDSDIWNKPPEYFKIWIYVLWIVNYADTKQFKRWENFFTFDEIARNCKTNYNVVNKCIVYLRWARQIETQKTTRGVIIKVINYTKYQDLNNYQASQKQDKSKIEAKQKQNKSNTIKEETKKQRNKEINNNISKDISLLEDESSTENLQVVETFWNDEINKMQDIIKNTIESLDMIYKPWKYERSRIKNIISWKAFWIVCEKHWMSRSDFVISIINLASKLKYAKKINNAVDFYENYASVYNLALQTKKWFLENKREIW